MLDWRSARSISSARIVASTSIWIFIVPMLLKIIDVVNDGLSGSVFKLSSVPDSFMALYLSGVAFFLGSIVYFLSAPKIIIDYKSFSEYQGEGAGAYSLEEYVSDLSEKESKRLKDKLVENVAEASASDIDNSMASCLNIGVDKLVFNYGTNDLKSVFWVVYHYSLGGDKVFCFFSLFFHMLGFIGLAYLFFYNLAIVLSNLFS